MRLYSAETAETAFDPRCDEIFRIAVPACASMCVWKRGPCVRAPMLLGLVAEGGLRRVAFSPTFRWETADAGPVWPEQDIDNNFWALLGRWAPKKYLTNFGRMGGFFLSALRNTLYAHRILRKS